MSDKLKEEYKKNKSWGMIASIDLHDCDPKLISNKKDITRLIVGLCNHIGMKRYKKPLIEKFAEGSMEGYSAIQFIETSSITMHFDDKIGNRAFIDIFSCEYFNPIKAEAYCKKFLKAGKSKHKAILRY